MAVVSQGDFIKIKVLYNYFNQKKKTLIKTLVLARPMTLSVSFKYKDCRTNAPNTFRGTIIETEGQQVREGLTLKR